MLYVISILLALNLTALILLYLRPTLPPTIHVTTPPPTVHVVYQYAPDNPPETVEPQFQVDPSPTLDTPKQRVLNRS